MSTILIVQFDEAISDGWRVALEGNGYTVLSARDTRTGTIRVREGGIDLIVVDSPDPTGILGEFVEELDRLPDAPPFVLISESPHAPEASARIGAAAFVPKPCSPLELIEIVARIFAAPVVTFEEDPTTRVERLKS